MGIADGVGIHGTAEDWSIGSRASHGCIRMHVADVDRPVPAGPGRHQGPDQVAAVRLWSGLRSTRGDRHGQAALRIFMAPFHPAGENPTLALQRDLELIEHLDRLGYDEAWIGEHHSAGTEIIASPEIFIATAAERTRHIKLGTGVTSRRLPQPAHGGRAHGAARPPHPRPVHARRRARARCRPTATMIGLDPTDTRELLEEDLDVIMRLLRSDEPVTVKTRRTSCVDARLHLRPVHRAAASTSPSPPSPRRPGPRLAGRYGIGLLSIGATHVRTGFDVLGLHWDVDGGARRDVRHDGRPREVAAGRPDAHRRDQGAGLQGRRVRHRAVVPLLPEGRGLPADGGRGRQRRAR